MSAPLKVKGSMGVYIYIYIYIYIYTHTISINRNSSCLSHTFVLAAVVGGCYENINTLSLPSPDCKGIGIGVIHFIQFKTDIS